MTGEKGQLVAGVDGGNTKTVALVCNLDGEALGVARGGSSNHEGIGAEKMAEVISQCLDGALAEAGAGRDALACAHLCLAGVDWPDDIPRTQQPLVAAGWSCPLTIENDSFLSVRASSPEGYGVGVMAGTSMCAAIIAPDGDKWFYGGFTDLGGGIHTHQFSLHAIIREADGRAEPTALTPAVLKATGFATVADLVHAIHRDSYYVSARIMHPVLFEVAATGDPVAVRIVRDFSKELALTATTLIRRYQLTDTDVPVVASGSRFTRTGPLLFEGFREAVLAVAPKARLILADDPPVTGAARGALEAAGRRSPEVWRNIGKSVAAKGWVDRIWGERS
jgi:N-acetylglucosamine kinase-like BadF-type ATPase